MEEEDTLILTPEDKAKIQKEMLELEKQKEEQEEKQEEE